MDVAKRVAVRAKPTEVPFANIDLTAHVFRAPVGGWLGLDPAASFGPDGAGLIQSVVHDAHGPFATSSQSLVLAMQR